MEETVQTPAWVEELQKIEKEISEKVEARNSILQSACGETVEDYTLSNWEGSTTKLSDMFGDKNELIVVHNMGKGCPYCTLWADGFSGVTDHLSDRAAFVVVSPNSPEVQKEFAESRSWSFPMYSSEGSNFTKDMGYSREVDGQTWYDPGFSVFKKEEDGSIKRVARDYFGPGDMYAGIWHFFNLLPEGPNGWQPKFSY